MPFYLKILYYLDGNMVHGHEISEMGEETDVPKRLYQSIRKLKLVFII